MANKLGKYTVPLSEELAGANDACRGEGTNGLQVNFENAIEAFKSQCADKGVILDTGYSGYVSRSSAEEWAKGGNNVFLKNIKYFGWGLALECENPRVDATHQSDPDAKKLANSMVITARSYGLDIVTVRQDGVDKLRFLKPYYLSFSDDVSEVFYEGDNTDNSTQSSTDASVSSVAYFFANQFQSVQDVGEAFMLQGERALANDEPLWNSVKKAVNASLRSCASGPDGEFIAWYPDYWGMYGNKTPYLILEDIELKDLTITQSDDEYYSHVFVPGVDQMGSSISYIYTQGVVSIESDTAAKVSSAASGDDAYYVSDEVSSILKELIYIPEGEEWRYTPKELYRRYGARPNTTPSLSSAASLIETGTDEEEGTTKPQYILPFLYALYEFMYHWANQYQATLSMTFQPGLFPGCRIKVKSLDISFYVEEVTHNVSYEDGAGFTTTARCTCPVGSLVSGMVNPNKEVGSNG